MNGIKIIDGGGSISWYAKNDFVLLISGKEIAVSSYAGIILQGETPVTVSYSRILHKPLCLDFVQDDRQREVISFYINQSYQFDFLMLVLLIAMAVLFRKRKNTIAKVTLNFYVFLGLFVFVFIVQICNK